MAVAGTSLVMLLVAGGLSAGAVRPPHLPWWMAGEGDISDRVTLHQDVAFTRSGIRICRALINRSDRALVINKLLVGGGDRGQLTSWRFDAHGVMILPRRPFGHGAYLFPIIPAGPDDTRPYELVEPNGSVTGCEEIARPRETLFQLVSNYRSDLDGDQVPASFALGRTLISRGQVVISGVCVVNVRRRRAACSDERRWTLQPRPEGQ